jgi:hypothetical protein
METLLGFFSGVAVTLSAALFIRLLMQRHARRKVSKKRELDIYIKLTELYYHYFWLTSAEFDQQSHTIEIKSRCRDLASQIIDLVSKGHRLEFRQEIMDVTMAARYATTREHHVAMERLLDRMGERVNPRDLRRVRAIRNPAVGLLVPNRKAEAIGI